MLIVFCVRSIFTYFDKKKFSFLFLDKSTTTNIADFIQPSLGQLQPNLDEFMDTIEPLQGTYNTLYDIIIINNICMYGAYT